MKTFGYKELVAAGMGSVVILYGLTVYAPADNVSTAELEVLPAAVIQQPPPDIAIEPEKPKLLPYLEVTDSCGPYFEGACVNVRSGPGTEHTAVLKFRAGAVLHTNGSVEREGRTWYKIGFNEWIRYPERVNGDLYIAADFVRPFFHEGPVALSTTTPAPEDKRILIDRSDQKLYAYEGETLFMEEPISTGLELTPTPRGNFKVFWKTPSRYMQGPIPEISEDEYDLPGVPWNLYFTEQGAAIHGAYWHDRFGEPWSHGCVNMPPEKAKQLYEWADLGTPVLVRD